MSDNNHDVAKNHIKGHSIFKGDNVIAHNANQVELHPLNSSTYHTVDDWFNTTQSAGKLTGGEFTDNADGTLAVSAGTGVIKATDSAVAETMFFDWVADTNVSLVDNSTNFIYVDYNSGNPIILTSTSLAIVNNRTTIALGKVFREGTTLHLIAAGMLITEPTKNTLSYLTQVFGQVVRASGSVVSETGTRNLATTAGVNFAGLTRLTTAGQDTSGADTFEYYYYNGSAWIENSASQIDNLQYNDTSTGLVTLTANRYGVHWVYVDGDIDGKILVVYGQGDYTLAQAVAASPPATLPDHVEQFAFIAAKIIIQKSAVAFLELLSAYDTTFTPSSVANHNELGGLQGGAADNYFHLDATPYTNLYQQDQEVLTTSSPTFSDVSSGGLDVTGVTNFVGAVVQDGGNFIFDSATGTYKFLITRLGSTVNQINAMWVDDTISYSQHIQDETSDTNIITRWILSHGVGNTGATTVHEYQWYYGENGSEAEIMNLNKDGDLTIVGGLGVGSDLTIAGSLTVSGDMTVNGTEFIQNVEVIEVTDNTIILNANETGSGITAGMAGVIFDRGTANDYAYIFDEGTGLFRIGEYEDARGDVVSSTSTTIVLDGNASAVDDTYNGKIIKVYADNETTQFRTITDYVGSTKTATVSAWSVNPDSDWDYEVNETDNTQAIATREDSPTNTAVAFWDDGNNRFGTDSRLTFASGVLTLTSDVDQRFNLNAIDDSWAYMGFLHSGVRKAYFGIDSTPNVILAAEVGSVRITGTTRVDLEIGGVDKLIITTADADFSVNVGLQDNNYLYLGTGEDSSWVHDGSNTIFNHTGTGNTYFRDSGSNRIYYTSGGVYISGTPLYNPLDNSGFYTGAGNDLRMYHSGSHAFINNTVGNLEINTAQIVNDLSGDFLIRDSDALSVTLFEFDTSAREMNVGTSSDTVHTTNYGDINILGNNELMLNTDDLVLDTDGTNGYIKGATRIYFEAGGVTNGHVDATGWDFDYRVNIAADVTITDASPKIRFIETGATADEGKWDFSFNADKFQFLLINDAEDNANFVFEVDRTGIVADSITFNPNANFNLGIDITSGDLHLTTGDIYLDGTNPKVDLGGGFLQESSGNYLYLGYVAEGLRIFETSIHSLVNFNVQDGIDVIGKITIDAPTGNAIQIDLVDTEAIDIRWNETSSTEGAIIRYEATDNELQILTVNGGTEYEAMNFARATGVITSVKNHNFSAGIDVIGAITGTGSISLDATGDVGIFFDNTSVLQWGIFNDVSQSDRLGIFNYTTSTWALVLASDGDATFGADVTATGDVGGATIGGITEANLVDKTAIETISGAWTFTDNELRLEHGSPTLTIEDTSDDDDWLLQFEGTSGIHFRIGGLAGGGNPHFDSPTSKTLEIVMPLEMQDNITFSGAETIAGIVNTNLLDKTATEIITGAYTIDNGTGLTFNNQSTGGDPILRSSSGGQYLDLTGHFRASTGFTSTSGTNTFTGNSDFGAGIDITAGNFTHSGSGDVLQFIYTGVGEAYAQTWEHIWNADDGGDAWWGLYDVTNGGYIWKIYPHDEDEFRIYVKTYLDAGLEVDGDSILTGQLDVTGGTLAAASGTYATNDSNAAIKVGFPTTGTHLFMGAESGDIVWLQVQNTDSSEKRLQLNPVGGYVGIGKDPDGATLDVAGGIVKFRSSEALKTDYRMTFLMTDAEEGKIYVYDDVSDIQNLIIGNSSYTAGAMRYVPSATMCEFQADVDIDASLDVGTDVTITNGNLKLTHDDSRVGIGVTPNSRVGLYLQPVIEDDGTNVLYAIINDTTYSYANAGNITDMYDYYGLTDYAGTDSIANWYGIRINQHLNNASSTVTNRWGVRINDITVSSGTVTNNYGLYIDTHDNGTNNYAIYSAGGQNHFADEVSIAVSGTPYTTGINKLHVWGGAWFSQHNTLAQVHIAPIGFDNSQIGFDCFYDGSTTRSSDAGSNFMIQKTSDTFKIRAASGFGSAANITSWLDAMVVSTDTSIDFTNTVTIKRDTVTLDTSPDFVALHLEQDSGSGGDTTSVQQTFATGHTTAGYPNGIFKFVEADASDYRTHFELKLINVNAASTAAVPVMTVNYTGNFTLFNATDSFVKINSVSGEALLQLAGTTNNAVNSARIDLSEYNSGTSPYYGAWIRYDGSANKLFIGTQNAGSDVTAITIARGSEDVLFAEDITVTDKINSGDRHIPLYNNVRLSSSWAWISTDEYLQSSSTTIGLTAKMYFYIPVDEAKNFIYIGTHSYVSANNNSFEDPNTASIITYYYLQYVDSGGTWTTIDSESVTASVTIPALGGTDTDSDTTTVTLAISTHDVQPDRFYRVYVNTTRTRTDAAITINSMYTRLYGCYQS